MKQYSHSRVETFNTCPKKFKYNYIDKLEMLPNTDPQNPLYLGTALHHGIEQDVESSVKEYFMSYPVITSLHSFEAIKLEHWITQVKELITGENRLTFELFVSCGEFKGYIDLIEWLPDGTVAIYDFKYSNNIDHYMESPQVHLYQYYFEKMTGTPVSRLGFIFIPKVTIRQKKTENESQFIARLHDELGKKQIVVKEVIYNSEHIDKFKHDIKRIESETEYKPNKTKLCDWCQYKELCHDGNDLNVIGGNEMLLPKNERTQRSTSNKKKLFFYAAPFTGKTYLANSFPDVLFLSTDGNYTNLPDGIPPHVDIKDMVTVNGRIVEKKLAWEVFKDVIAELELKQNDFKTIAVDLLEDTYEHCRVYMFDKLGITHESDDPFRAYDKVRVEFLGTIKRLMNLDYENIILLSHEDSTKDITKKTGDKITAIKPNLNDKIANKISGMVDVVARIVAEDNNRVISFKASEVVFGGGRLNITEREVPCTYEALMSVYEQSNSGAVSEAPQTVEATPTEAPVERPRARKTR